MLKKLRIILSIISFALVFVYCIAFAVQNSTLTAVYFLTGSAVELPLALWFGLVLAFGCMVGILVASYSIATKKRQIKRLQKQLDSTEERLSRLP
ncbi:LapA family protein [Oceanobacter kriegii]|uniref:LapA family protein n=1 Tax=Oceanobacter kriegii TaxID=64972 RepID=UPI000487BF2B|nr:LapA family protein [Oceanobacter kriegii]